MEGNASMNEEVPKKKRFKRILKWVLGISLTLIVLLGAAFAYLYNNQEQLRNVLVGQVNSYIDPDVKVKVAAIELDFFSRFPEVSFRFDEVFCNEVNPPGSQDTLFYFESIYFEFNLWQLIQSKYELKGITFDEGHVELRISRTGRENYRIWKESTDTTESSLTINLENVQINNTEIYFADQGADFKTQVQAHSLSLNGALSDGAFASTLRYRGVVDYLITQEIDYLPSRKVLADLDLHVDGDSTFIDGGEISIDGMLMAARGYLANGQNHWDLSGEDLSLSKLITLLPPTLLPDKSLVEADGTFQLNLGLDIRDKSAFITADTRMSNATLDLKRSGMVMSDLSFNGHFDNGSDGTLESTTLRVQDIKARTRTGELNASLSIRNFVTPKFSVSGNLAVDFAEALDMAGTDIHERAEGRLSGDFRIEKRYTAFDNIQAEGLADAYLHGNMNLTGGALRVRDSEMELEDLEATLSFEGADINVQNLNFRSKNSDFRAMGSIENAIVFGATPSPVFRLSLHSNDLVLEDVLAWQLNHRSETSENSEPLRFDFNVSLTVDEFQHRSFKATKLSGQIYSQGKDIVGNDLRFNAVDGSIAADFRWHPDGDVTLLTTKGSLTSVDIHQLFSQFDNFGQSSLTADNIYGQADVDYAVNVYFDSEMRPVLESLVSETDFRITDGRLVDYKPLESLSRFAEISELRDVQFATLENHLSIDDQNIHIPGMNVKSSVLELWVEGDHSFNNDIDYSLKLQLLDALGTRRRTSEELAEFIVESNRQQPLIPVRIYGTLDNPRISLDRTLLSQGIEDEWRSEGEELRQLMRGEEDPTEEEPRFIFEWNDERDTTRRR